MADQPDLGIPMKPSPPVPAMPARVPDVPRPGTSPVLKLFLSRADDLIARVAATTAA
jgi:hypothetical protein